jgi:alkylation response protein AidB-like acyl-CoA dehydrogenase
MAALGFRATIPEKYGGSGKGLTELCLVVEELARASAAVDDFLRISLSLVASAIKEAGTEEQKKHFLRPHATGEKMACFALSEAGSGSDPASMQTTAVRKKNGYVINGNKLFISTPTGRIVLPCYVDKALKGKGVTAFVMDKDTPGITVTEGR